MILSVILALFLQVSTAVSSQPSEPSIANLLNNAERSALVRSASLPAKIQALLAAAKRMLKEAGQMLKEDKSTAMLDALASYSRILEYCEWQMHNQPAGGKRLNYKKQEIELRRQLQTLDDLSVGSDLDEKPAIQEVIHSARALRTHFLTSFFGQDSLKRP
jgi:hypothetical protein